VAIPLADIESLHTQKVPRCLALHAISKRGGRDEAPEEPVFAARTGAARDEGWLIVQCLDGRSERAFFALFDATHVDTGPIARIHLPHHLPISFRGWWIAE
jgi:carotenoid cleavage dioxygenase-like enzyme